MSQDLTLHTELLTKLIEMCVLGFVDSNLFGWLCKKKFNSNYYSFVINTVNVIFYSHDINESINVYDVALFL